MELLVLDLLFLVASSVSVTEAQVPLGRLRLDGQRLEMLVPLSNFTCEGGERDIRQDGGIWSTVSLDMFDFYEGDLACREMGFEYADMVGPVTASTPTSADRFAAVEVANLSCPVFNVQLFDCPRLPSTGSCDHSRDVALVCSSQANPARLVPQTGLVSDQQLVGRLELILGSQPGSVCSDTFDMMDANVACRQLGHPLGAVGYGSASALGYDSSANEGDPIWLSGLGCEDTFGQANLRTCPHNGTNVTGSCNHGDDVILSCLREGSLRLVSNDSELTAISTSGRLEIFVDGEWGTLCGPFNQAAANLACRQLGFPSAEQFGTTLSIPAASSSVPIHFKGVECSGDDSSLSFCSTGFVEGGCGHPEDVGLVCATLVSPTTPPSDPAVTLGTVTPSVENSEVLSPEAIIGIAAGGGVAILIFCFCLCLCCCCYCGCCGNRKRDSSGDKFTRDRARTMSDPPTTAPPPPPGATITTTTTTITSITEKSLPGPAPYPAKLGNSLAAETQEPRYTIHRSSHEPAAYTVPVLYASQDQLGPLPPPTQPSQRADSLSHVSATSPFPVEYRDSLQGSTAYPSPQQTQPVFIPQPPHHRDSYSQGSAHFPAMGSGGFYQDPSQHTSSQMMSNPGYMPPAEALASHQHDPVMAPPQIIAVSPYLDPSSTVTPSAPPL